MHELISGFDALFFIRHGYEVTGEIGLSDFGRMQMEYLKNHMESIMYQEYGNVDFSRVFISCSSEQRALDSVKILHEQGEICVIMDEFYLQSRDEIFRHKDPNKMLGDMLESAFFHKADAMIVIAHGDVPVVLAEEAALYIHPDKDVSFKSIGNGEGFCIMPRASKICKICIGGFDEIQV